MLLLVDEPALCLDAPLANAVRFQADVENIGNTLELIDFGGLFSGAIGPARQFTFRLVTTF